MYSTLNIILLGAAVAAAAPAGYNTTLTQRSTVGFPPNSTNATAPTNSTQRVDSDVDDFFKSIDDLLRDLLNMPEFVIVPPPVPINKAAPANGTAPTGSTTQPDAEGKLEAIYEWLQEVFRGSKEPTVSATASANGTIPPHPDGRPAKLTYMLNKCNIDGYVECQSSGGENCDAELDKTGECSLHDFVKGLVAQSPKVPEGAIVFGDGEILHDGKVVDNIKDDSEWSTDA